MEWQCLADGCQNDSSDDYLRHVHFRRFSLRGVPRPGTDGPHLNCPPDSPHLTFELATVESRWTSDYCGDHKNLAGRIGVYCESCQKLRPRRWFGPGFPEDEYSGSTCKECSPRTGSRVVSFTLYRMFDGTGRLLYVGKTVNYFRRISDHSTEKSWWRKVVKTTFEHFNTHNDLLTAEYQAIRSEKPLHNIVHNGRR